MIRCALLLLVALAGAVEAQSTSPSATPDVPNRFWRCDLPGGIYEVAVRAIISVSTHEYVVDNAARVTEVNVDTQGNMAVRFYFIEPNTPKAPSGIGQSAIDRVTELTKEAGDRLGVSDAWKKVVKSYPTSTHAHTVEYRVDTEDQLKQIFTSVQNCFETGRGGSLKLGGSSQ